MSSIQSSFQSDPAPEEGPRLGRVHREVFLLVQRAYELMVILDGDLEEAAVETNLNEIHEAITTEGGQVATQDLWGKRRFAYEINHKTEGYYALFEIVTETAGLPTTERQLRLADDVVRHLLVRLPDREAARRGLLAPSATA